MTTKSVQKLEDLRRRGSLCDAEFAQAKAVLLAGGPIPAKQPLSHHLSDQLTEVRYQNELARIDREWQIDRQQYMAADRYARQQRQKSLQAEHSR